MNEDPSSHRATLRSNTAADQGQHHERIPQERSKHLTPSPRSAPQRAEGQGGISRNTFVKRLLSAGLFVSLGRYASAMVGDRSTAAAIGAADAGARTPLIDLHCHPPLKHYLWERKLWQKHASRAGANIANMQVDIHHLEQGGVSALAAVHYIPERGLVEQAGTLRKLFPRLRFLFPVFVDKLEKGTSANYRQMNTMMDDFEEQVRLTNLRHKGRKMRIAKGYSELERIMADGDIAVFHTIEGAHALGRELCCDTGDKYIEHLDHFMDRGVSMMTLAHFFANDVVSPVEGIPPSMKKDLQLHWRFDPTKDDKPLTAIGRRVVERMLERGMVVDLTHSAPAARKDVYALNQKYNRPLVFSHVGVRANFKGPDHFKYMAPDDEEIRIIARCGGVIGVIFMNFWLSGCEPHTKQCPRPEWRNGMEEVLATIQHIHTVTGSYEHIAIGSDFDGLADAPHDLRDHSCMDALRDGLATLPGITPADIEHILYKNSLRVLRHGWRN